MGLVLVSGCSLVLEDAPIPTCTEDDQCMPLSRLRGHPATCHKFFCNDGRCVEHADGTEICDGHDNDCDGVIDEPSAGQDGPWRAGGVLVEGVSSSNAVRYGGGPEQRAVATWRSRDGARHANLVVDSTTSPESIDHMTNVDDSLLSGDLRQGCRNGSGAFVPTCNLAEVTSDPTSAHEILAAVATDGCAKGRLQIGHTPPTGAFESVPMVLRGPLRRSNSFFGVDVGDDSCTGASRPECADSDACGAARPAVAAIDEGVPTSAAQQRAAEALVAWIGAPLDRDQCGGAGAPVEAVVAHLLRVQIGSPFFWTTVSNEGSPAVLGRTTGGGAPAVANWESNGWFVAFADEAGGVAMRWIPSQPEPPEVTDGTADDRTGVETPPIDGIVELGTVDAAGDTADHVSIAVGSIRPGGVELGVAWHEGCGETDQSIVFRRVLVTTSGASATGIDTVGDAVVLERVAGSDALGWPTITYRNMGIVVQGFSRGGATADDGTDGGWTVAWSLGEDTDGDGDGDVGGRIHAARIAELDGLAVADGAIGDLTQGADANADEPFLYSGTRYAYRDLAGETFVGGPLACTP